LAQTKNLSYGRRNSPDREWNRELLFESASVRAYRGHCDLSQPVSRKFSVASDQGWVALSSEGCLIAQSPQGEDRYLVGARSGFLVFSGLSGQVVYGRGLQDWIEIEWEIDRLRPLRDWLKSREIATSEGRIMVSGGLEAEDSTGGSPLARVRQALTHTHDGTEPLVVGALYELCAKLTCHATRPLLGEPEGELPDSIANLIKFVRTDPARAWSLRDAAHEIGYSPFHLSRTFRASMPYGFPEYVERCRAEVACQDVLTTRESVEKIAIEKGFGSAQAMRDAFRRHFGLLPNEIRTLGVYTV